MVKLVKTARNFGKPKIQNRESFFSGILTSKFLIFGVVLGIIFFGKAFFTQLQKNLEMRKEIANIEQKIQGLLEENRNISASLEDFSKESYLEKEARKRLNLQKPGEKVIIVLPPDQVYPEKESKEKSTLEKIWNWWQERFGKD